MEHDTAQTRIMWELWTTSGLSLAALRARLPQYPWEHLPPEGLALPKEQQP